MFLGKLVIQTVKSAKLKSTCKKSRSTEQNFLRSKLDLNVVNFNVDAYFNILLPQKHVYRQCALRFKDLPPSPRPDNLRGQCHFLQCICAILFVFFLFHNLRPFHILILSLQKRMAKEIFLYGLGVTPPPPPHLVIADTVHFCLFFKLKSYWQYV